MVFLTSGDGCQAAKHSGECNHRVEMTSRGRGCRVDKQGQEDGVVYADVGGELGDTRVHQCHAKLARNVDRACSGNTLDNLTAPVSGVIDLSS